MKKFCSTLEDIAPLIFVGERAMQANFVKKVMIYHGFQEFQKKLAKDIISKDNINLTEFDNDYKMYV